MPSPAQGDMLPVQWSGVSYPPNIGFFSDALMERASALAAWTQHIRKWKKPTRDLTPYTEWFKSARTVQLPALLLPKLDEEAEVRHKRGGQNRKGSKMQGIDLDLIGVRGDAAWAIFLGLPIEGIFEYNPRTRFLGDIPIPGTPHAIEVKTSTRRLPNPHLTLQAHLKEPKAAAYALAMPTIPYPKDMKAISEILLVGWQSKNNFKNYGVRRTLSERSVLSMTTDELQPPQRLKDKVESLLNRSNPSDG